jgi:predicted anti-sigma-YlaC factor YlaD
MTCAAARRALLEADLEALRPGAVGPLAAHLAGCGACRAAADRILAGSAALAAARGVAPRRAASPAATAARGPGRTLRARRRRLRVLVPVLAAAAALTLVVLRGLPPAAPDPGPPAAPVPSVPPLVEAGGQNVVVFATTRPDITVVWQF